MRIPSILLTLLLCGPLQAVEKEFEELVTRLMECREPTEFNQTHQEARKAGLSHQALLETRFLFLVDQGEDEDLIQFLPSLESHLPNVRIADSLIFAVEEDYQAIVEYLRALRALALGDDASFEKHIKEAFWLSPTQAGVFGPRIEAYRQKKNNATLRVDLDHHLRDQLTGTPLTLRDLVKDRPTFLLHFWSAFSSECQDSLPDFLQTSTLLTKNEIPVISILLAATGQAEEAALATVKQLPKPQPGFWLSDDRQGTFSLPFRIQNFPAIALVTEEGKVLFNGHPGDPEFWSTLQRLSPSVVRPSAPARQDEEKESAAP